MFQNFFAFPVHDTLSPAHRIKTELMSGLTVALALVPEAVAFAFVAGVHPLVGLYAAFIVGLITAVMGGKPGMISGATGALAVVMVALVATHGVEYLFAAVVLMGILQVVFGLLKLGKLIRMVPHPVMLGFVNGLAIVIFLAQLTQFKTADASGNVTWMAGETLALMLGLVALTMGYYLCCWQVGERYSGATACDYCCIGACRCFRDACATCGRYGSNFGWITNLSYTKRTIHTRNALDCPSLCRYFGSDWFD